VNRTRVFIVNINIVVFDIVELQALIQRVCGDVDNTKCVISNAALRLLIAFTRVETQSVIVAAMCRRISVCGNTSDNVS
jgi:hypothetical protein